MQNEDYRLEFEEVPETLWGINLRRAYSTFEWDQVRKKCYIDNNYTCSICGKTCFDSHDLHCHEVWGYNDQQHIQTLDKLTAICSTCHHLKHPFASGLYYAYMTRNMYPFDRLIVHFLEVNGCSFGDFVEKLAVSYERWFGRSKHQWSQKLAKFDNKQMLPLFEDLEPRTPRPTRASKEYHWWLHTFTMNSAYPTSSKESGHWLLSCNWQEVDAVWNEISDLTQSGKLGNFSKVTSRNMCQSRKDTNYYICVSSYSYLDRDDIDRIEDQILKVIKPMRRDTLIYRYDYETLLGNLFANIDF